MSTSVTPTILSYVDPSSSIQTQIDTKAPAASPSLTGTITTPLTASRVVVLNASSQLAAATTTAASLNALAGSIAAGTFTPTVTLVGGAGNTTPVYSTNTGRYTQVGNIVFVDVYLTGDGGNEGAGTGVMNVALPVTASASHPTQLTPIGYAVNNTTEFELYGIIAGSATTISIQYPNTLSAFFNFTGAQQNNATRTVRLKFWYEV